MLAVIDGRRPCESCADATAGELCIELSEVRRTDARPLARMLRPIDSSSSAGLLLGRTEDTDLFSMKSSRPTAISLLLPALRAAEPGLLLETLNPALLPGIVSGLNGAAPAGRFTAEGRLDEVPCEFSACPS